MFITTVKHALPIRSIPLNRFQVRILYMTTRERIKEVRELLELTGEAFGKLAGVSKAAVSQWESGRTTPQRDALLSLKRKRGISPEWITSGKGEMFDAVSGSFEMSEEWDLLTHEQRQEFIGKIKAQAASNKTVVDELSTKQKPAPKMPSTAVAGGPPREKRSTGRRKVS